MCEDNGYPFIATLHNVILASDLCDGLFSIITLMNLRIAYLFRKGFAWCTLEPKRNYWLPYHIVHKGNMHFGENKGNDGDKEITIWKEHCSRIIASKIRSQIHQIIVGWGYF